MPLVHRLDIFISSPSDVSDEREVILRVVERLNRNPFIRRKYFLNPLAYEREVPPDAGAPAQLIVDRYMGESKDSYLVVCLMWSRMGTPFTDPHTGRQYQSGTEYEYLSAYERKLLTGKPHLLLYRKIQDLPEPSGNQTTKVEAFFNRFEGPNADLKGIYKTYKTLAEFEELLYDHIGTILNEYPPEAEQSQNTPVLHNQEIAEEVRRLDAAVPRQVTVDQPTELWAQICLPDSRGFRDLLPYETNQGDIIDQQDVREGNLAIAFPLSGGRLQPIVASLEVAAPDFDLLESKQEILLGPHLDSGRLVFQMIPIRPQQRSIIRVTVRSKTPDGLVITLGSVSLSTEAIRSGSAAQQAGWNVLTVSLSTHSSQARAQSVHRLSAGYTVEALLGTGGAGSVDIARSPNSAETVVIRRLETELANQGGSNRIEQEASILARLHHPYIEEFVDYGEIDGKSCLVTTYIAGSTLAQHLHVDHHFKLPDAVSILREIASAVDYIHELGIVHRNISASTIMLQDVAPQAGESYYRAILVGFGAAISMADVQDVQQAHMAGTPAYMSPEQWRNEAYDGRADIYALGIVAFEMVTGEVPFGHHDIAKIMSAHLFQPAPDPRSLVPDLPHQVATAILRALEKEPTARYSQALDFISDMDVDAREYPTHSRAD